MKFICPVRPGDHNEELRYAARSWETNLHLGVGGWDEPERMYQRKSKTGFWHRACGNKTRSERKQRSKTK